MLSVHKIDWKKLGISLAISLGTGIISALITMPAMDAFALIEKPPLTPPDFLFPIVWTILFTLMGISSYIIYKANDEHSKTSLAIYGLQLIVNFFWPIFFFNLQAYLFSFIWILLLWVLIIVMIYQFSKTSKIAALLQVPYFLWVTFAAYLNFGVYLLNR